MNSQPLKPFSLAVASVMLGAVLACAPGDTGYRIEDTASGRLFDETEWIRDSLHTDAGILGALEEVHDFEVEAGKLARSRASDSAVRIYADLIIEDHERLEDLTDSLARSADIDPVDAPDGMRDLHERKLDSLRSIDDDDDTRNALVLPGDTLARNQTGSRTTGLPPTRVNTRAPSNFDRAFIAQQIAGHKHTLNLIDTSVDRAQNSALRNALTNELRPVVADHLRRAEEIQRRISPTVPPILPL